MGRTAPPPHLRAVLEQRGCALKLCASARDVDESAAIVLAPRETFGAFRELIDGDRLFYLAPQELPERELLALIDGMAGIAGDAPLPAADTLRRLALAPSLAELAAALQTAIVRAAAANRGRCFVFDRERQALCAPAEDAGGGESAAVGLISFVLRAGAALRIARAGDDCRFDGEIDGKAADRFLAVPLRAGGEVVAVLAAARPPRERPFEPRDVAAMEALAVHAAPYLAAWLPAAEEEESPFRKRALRELEMPAAAGPEPLRLDPAWTRRASWLAVTAFFAALLAAFFVEVPEYASGPAVVTGPRTVATSLPARYLPQLHRGMPLRVDLEREWLEVDSVEPHGALVIITARLPAAKKYPSGLRTRAQIRLQSKRLLLSLLPGAARG